MAWVVAGAILLNPSIRFTVFFNSLGVAQSGSRAGFQPRTSPATVRTGSPLLTRRFEKCAYHWIGCYNGKSVRAAALHSDWSASMGIYLLPGKCPCIHSQFFLTGPWLPPSVSPSCTEEFHGPCWLIIADVIHKHRDKPYPHSPAPLTQAHPCLGQ